MYSMWESPIIIYKPVTYVTREYTTAGWVEVEWIEYAPFVEYPRENNMYTYVKGPEVKCSQCGSTDIAETVRKHPTQSTYLVCLKCGHRGGEKKSPFVMEPHVSIYTYTPPKEITF